jgi:hypothetical protein
MATLMSLPREIRLQILRYVVPPVSEATIPYFDLVAPQTFNPALPLLLVNHTINLETQSLGPPNIHVKMLDQHSNFKKWLESEKAATLRSIGWLEVNFVFDVLRHPNLFKKIDEDTQKLVEVMHLFFHTVYVVDYEYGLLEESALRKKYNLRMVLRLSY